MVAQIKELQSSLDEFLKNEFLRKFYEDAPTLAKEMIKDGFRASLSDDEVDEEENINWDDKMTINDIKYLAERGYHPMMRKHYAELLNWNSPSI